MWQEQARHCPLCGARLIEAEIGGRPRRRCERCSFVLYKNPASAALGVVFNAGGELLFVRRTLQPFAGTWSLPAGYQEIDEDARETVVREVREETGVEIEVEGLLDLVFVADDPRKPANVAVFLCRAVGGEARPGDEESAVDWFPLDALPEEIGFDNYPRILARLLDPEGYPRAFEDLRRRLLDVAPPERPEDAQP